MVLISLSKADKKRGIKLPTILCPSLSELCGIHIGDGYLGHRKDKHEYLIQCTGNLKDDREHYDLHIKELWEKVFGIKVLPKERKDNTYEIRVYSKTIALFFNEFLEMPIGKKSKTIRIPNVIKETCKTGISEQMKACIRGIIDTDFYFVRNNNTTELGAWFASRNLVIDLYDYLSLNGLKPRITLDNKYYNTSAKKMLIRHRIRICRKDDIKRWFDDIGTNNPKIYKRYIKFKG